MDVAVMCIGLLGLLVFSLGFLVSITRSRVGVIGGRPDDPADPLFKAIRAHGNSIEYAPMLSVLMYAVAATGGSSWLHWFMWGATASRYTLVAGILLSPTLDQPHPLRFAGALGTYACGVVLAVGLILNL